MPTSQPWPVVLFSGNRADYSLLVPLAQHLHTDDRFTPTWWLGTDHTSLGSIAHVLADAWPRVQVLPPPAQLPLSGSTPLTLQATQTHLHGVATLLRNHPPKPAACILLGDRFEAFAVALACFYYGIPIIHLAAGDTTQGGCPDDQLRFALSALASLHVCFSAQSQQRLQHNLAHTPALADRVLHVSSPVVESLAQLILTPKATLCQELDLNPNLPVALVTQHPIPPPAEAETTSVAGFESLLTTLAKIPNLQVILTSPNQDSPAGVAMQALAQAQATHYHSQGWRYQPTLGREAYLSWLAAASVVVGNTSSGLYETPCFGTPSISVGPRQAGRERAANVLSVPLGDEAALSEALTRALGDEAFIAQCQQVHSPFVLPQGQGGTGSQRIADALASLLAC